MKVERLGMSAAEEVRQLEKLRAWGTGPVPVPPFDETQRERSLLTLKGAILEGQKQRRTDRVRRRVSQALGGLAALAALSLFGLWIPGTEKPMDDAASFPQSSERGSSGDIATQARVVGTGMFSEPGRGTVPLTNLSELRPGGRVQAGPDGAVINTNTTKVVMDPRTIVTLARLTPLAEEWTIETGDARFSVDPERHKHVTVVSGDTRVEVVGTEFAVATEMSEDGPGLAKNRSTAVSVQKGRVTVRHSGHVYTLNPGDRWENEPKGSPALKTTQRRPARASASAKKSGLATKALDPGTTLAQENRLFHEALILRNAGHRPEALRAFAGFIARYPNSTLRPGAEHELERLRTGAP